MKPIEHLLLAVGVLAAILSVGIYYHLTLQKQVRTQQAEVETLRTELARLQKDPRFPQIETTRASIQAAWWAREQRSVFQQVRRFSRLRMTLTKMSVACKDGPALCQRVKDSRSYEAVLAPNGEVEVSFE